MTAHELHQRLTLPRPFVLLGLRMQPFSIGHAQLFDKIGITKSTDPAMLVLAIYVCAHRASVIEKQLESWWTVAKIKALAWINRKRLKRDKEELQAQFEKYLDYYNEEPDIQIMSESDGTNRIPFVQTLRVTLMRHLGYRSNDFTDTPINQAIWDYYTFMRSENAIEVLDGTARENAEQMTAYADEHRDEWLAKAREMLEARGRM